MKNNKMMINQRMKMKMKMMIKRKRKNQKIVHLKSNLGI
jgi:hypothetical protein